MSATVPVLDDRSYILPAGATGDVGYSGATWVYGAPVELASELDTDSILTGIVALTRADPMPRPSSGIQIALCVGDGDEPTIVSEYRTRAEQFVNTAGSSGVNFLPNMFGVDALPIGERLTWRLAKRDAVATPWTVRAQILKKPINGRLAQTARQYCLPNLNDDYFLACSVTTDVWTAWQSVRAAAGPAMYITHINLAQDIANRNIDVEFATGPSGSEDSNIIWRGRHSGGRMTDLIGGGHYQCVPRYVEPATRLAWRCRNRNSSGTAAEVFMSLTYVTSYLDWFEQS